MFVLIRSHSHTDQFQYDSPCNASANCISPKGIWEQHYSRFPLLLFSSCCCLHSHSDTQDNLRRNPCHKWKRWPFPVQFIQGLFPSLHFISQAEEQALCPGMNWLVSSSICHLPLPHTCLRYCSPPSLSYCGSGWWRLLDSSSVILLAPTICFLQRLQILFKGFWENRF